MEDLMRAAANGETAGKDFTFFLSGDLNQMSLQKRFLNSHGIETQQSDVYPVVKTWDKKEALKLIWSNNVEGWWHYQDEYVKMEICTAELFKAKLNRSL